MKTNPDGILPRMTHAVVAALTNMLPPSRQELEERYLNNAKDIYDLEYRMRELDRHHPSLPPSSNDSWMH